MIVAYGGTSFTDPLAVKTAAIASYHQAIISSRVARDFWESCVGVGDYFFVGSFGRGTAIRRRPSMRLYVQLPGSFSPDYATALAEENDAILDRLRTSLMSEYGQVRVDPERPAVHVKFGCSPRIDVVPVFRSTRGELLIPGRTYECAWRLGDPMAEIDEINRTDSELGGNLLALCRLMRAWRMKHHIPISSLLLDTICYEFMTAWPDARQFEIELEILAIAFFAYLASMDESKDEWAAPGSRTILPRTSNFELHAQEAYDLAVYAAKVRMMGFIQESRAAWDAIFGVYV